METSSHPTFHLNSISIPAGMLYPGEHNKGRAHCKDCKVALKPGQGIRVYRWNGWTMIHLCLACARAKIAAFDFYWNRAFDAYCFTFTRPEVSGFEIAEKIWGSA